MSDNKTAVVKVKYFRKRTKQLDKLEFTHSDYLKIRKWFMTGTFTNKFLLNDDFDRSLMGLLKLMITQDPIKVLDIITETYEKSFNKNTFIYTLVLLSNSTFESKRIFKSLFNKIITNPKDLYKFMGFCKKERGFGQAIHNAIKDWFKSHDVNQLEKMFVEHRSGFGWKAQDVMRLIKPKPTDHKEQLLYKWLSKDTIGNQLDDNVEYQSLPYICAYERMRNNVTNERDVVEYIIQLRFKNSMIPGNVERTKKIISEWISDYDNPDSSFTNIPRYLDLLNTEAFKSLGLFMTIKNLTNKLSLFSIMSTYLGVKEKASTAHEMDLLNELENLLIDRVKKHTDKTTLNLVDTCDDMFTGKVNNLPDSPAIVSSIMIGTGNSIDFQGNKITRSSSRGILEAERKSSNNVFPNYNKIVDALNENPDVNLVIVWSNRDTINKEIFTKRFDSWKNEKKRIIKLVFVNLGMTKKINSNENKEVFAINEKTEKLLAYIKNGEI